MVTKLGFCRSIAWLFLFVQSVSVFAAELNTDANGRLAKGYDLVSFFEGNPTQGSPEFQARFAGAEIHFSSKANVEKFLESPQRYMPQFGGFCAYGIRHGKKLDIDPIAYAIEGGQLYFLLNAATKTLWDEERERNISIANKVWATIRSESLARLSTK